jgi:alanine racemase
VIRNPAFAPRPPDPAPPAWIEVDLAALGHNLAALRARLPRRAELWAVVKADAYGHGAIACAREALGAGAARLVVARVREAEQLREAGIDAPLLVLGPLQPDEARTALRTRAAICVGDPELAHALSDVATGPVDVHLKVDTGMARYGVPAPAAAAFARQLARLPGLRVCGVASHLIGRGPGDLPALRRQAQAFRAVCAELEVDGLRPVRHLANTLGLLALPQAHLDAVRVGGGLYGFDPCLGTRLAAGLRPVLALKSRLSRSSRSAPARRSATAAPSPARARRGSACCRSATATACGARTGRAPRCWCAGSACASPA